MTNPEEIKKHVKIQSKLSRFLVSPVITHLPIYLLLLIIGHFLSQLILTPSSSTSTSTINQYHLISCFLSLWIGTLIAIPFLEAWVKFNAPTVKREQALDIGRHVFSALNLLEFVFAGMLLSVALYPHFVLNMGGLSDLLQMEQDGSSSLFDLLFKVKHNLLVVTSLVMTKTIVYEAVYMIPQLAQRISDIICQVKVQPSKLHMVAVFVPFFKIVLLAYCCSVFLS